MKQIVVVSGKGGTGKTTLAGSLASLSKNTVVLDADVDAANLHLLFELNIEKNDPYFGGHKAVIKPEKCNGCGVCKDLCRFEAIEMKNKKAVINSFRCEGCNACVVFCPTKAIHLEAPQNGWIRSGNSSLFPFADGNLFPGEETSGGLVAEVRKKGSFTASEKTADGIIIDGAPGIGCPAISSMTYTDFAVLVTEPSQSGLHDLKRIAQTADRLKVHYAVVINKADIEPETSKKVEGYCIENEIEILGKIPFDMQVMTATREGKPLSQYNGKAATAVKEICAEILKRFELFS